MSVLSHLTSTSASLLNKGPNAASIATSIETLQTRLNSFFPASNLREHFVFGSWKRGVNLPRAADRYSDVDYMVVFKGDASAKPQTLLNRLKRFVESRYSTSDIKQSHPTIVLTLNHIDFELVPSIRLGDSDSGILQIPSSSSSYADWQATYPYLAASNIEKHNGDNSFLSKPLIRILKFWNCQADPYTRSYNSYEIEQFVVEKYFYPRANLKDYFYGAVESLPIAWNMSQNRQNRINRLKEIVAKSKQLENDNMPVSAELEIKKAIPEFN